jgi:hypothetical protein
MGYTPMHRSRSTAHLNRAHAPTMRGVHASPNDVAAAIVRVRIVVTIRVISIIVVVVIRIEAAAKSETVPEAVIMESTTMESTVVEAAGHAATEAAAKAATMESTTAEASTMKAAASEASTVKAAAAASAAVAATATSAATRQGHCWRHQAKGCNRRQCDNRFTQHSHSPSVISLPTTITVASGDRFGELPAKFAQLHAIRILNLMSGSNLVCGLRARCVQQKSPVETNPNLPSRGRKIRRRGGDHARNDMGGLRLTPSFNRKRALRYLLGVVETRI